MKPLFSQALKFENNHLWVLDQQKLPTEVEWIDCQSPLHMIDIIQSLKVRGEPLIGIAAALSLAHFVEQYTPGEEEFFRLANQLRKVKPTAIHLGYCIDYQLQIYRRTRDYQAVIQAAEALFLEEANLSTAVAEYGAKLIRDGENILTHCNTGGLVTTGIGTALGIIKLAHQQGKKIHVYVDETRPLLQGARLTAWELEQAGIPYTLICDNTAAFCMQLRKIDRILVGADRIAANGDAANKIGTYNLAVLAHYHHIPFHIAAPRTAIDWQCTSGNSICIEERAEHEVKGISGSFGEVTWTPEASHCFNPAFDVIPAELITSFILDNGVMASLKEELCA